MRGQQTPGGGGGEKLEEFLASNHLHVINDDNERTTFQGSRGKSNIDLTITNNQMLTDVTNWDISEEESASDHYIIKFNIRLDEHTIHGNNPSERYRIKEHQLTKFNEKLHSNIAKTFHMEDKERTTDELSSQVNENTDIGQFTVKLEEVIQTFRKIWGQKNPSDTSKRRDGTLVDGNTKNKKKDKRPEKTIPTDGR
jgi:hypothetical protein